jgi:surface carbohydrate biosynthesis protein
MCNFEVICVSVFLMNKRTIYICVEIKSREYVSNILLAIACALRGYRVYLGTHAAIYALIRRKLTSDGIFLDKSTQPETRMKWNRARTQYYCILDPELSPILPPNVLLEGFNSRVYGGSEALFDRFFVVGESAAKAARASSKDNSSKIRLTGWPRIDVWKEMSAEIYCNEIHEIRARHGEYILFVSSFGSVRDPEVTKNLRNADPISLTPLNDFNFAKLQHANFKKMVDLLRLWDKDPSLPKVVIKAHPSEPVFEWKKALKGLRKTVVVSKGEISPWIIASSGVIHHGSTSALEAYFAKKPVVIVKEMTIPYLLPIASGISEYEIAPSTSFEVFNFFKLRNIDFNPSVLDGAITTPKAGAVAQIIDVFDELAVKVTELHKRRWLMLSQIHPKSLRRAVGLVRDEIYWHFGKTNINSQLHFIPRGLDKKRIKQIKKIDPDFAKVKIRRMTINLWEFDV